jgi:exosortase
VFATCLIVLVFTVALLYLRVLGDLAVQWWEDPNYSHGFLVPVFSVLVAWRSRHALATLPTGGHWAGLALLAVGVLAFVLGDLAAEAFLTRSSLIVVVAGLVLFHLGARPLRLLAFPLGFLFFMVPLPSIAFYALALPLQRLAADNATTVLDLIGVPVLRDGNVVRLSQITLGVTEACSGVRSLISLVALAVGWASQTLRSWAALVLVAIAVPITIVTNVARIVITGLVGQWLGPWYAEGFFHVFSGWFIFLAGVILLLGTHGLLRIAGAENRGGERSA